MYTGNIQNNWNCCCINSKLGKTTKLLKTTLFAFENEATFMSSAAASLQLKITTKIMP